MAKIVDNLIAFRVLYMLVTKFEDTPAFKLGIINKEGNALKKFSELSTTEEKDAYTYLHRLVFKLKKLINKLPGGESKLKNIVAAYWLIKENYESDSRSLAFLEEQLTDLSEKLETVTLVEEELLVKEFMELHEDAPTMSTGAGTSTDQPVVRPGKAGRRYAQFTVNDDLFRRFSGGKKKYKKWSQYLNLEDEGERVIYDYARKNPKGVIVLQNGKNVKAIRFNRNGGGHWGKIKRTTKQVNNDVVA